MYSPLLPLFLLLCKHVGYTKAVQKCCPNENILIDEVCSDGSNITTLPCETKVPMSSSLYPSLTIEVNAEDILSITDLAGSLFVEPDKYCMTKDTDNATDVVILCWYTDENEESVEENIIVSYLQPMCAFISTLFLSITFVVYLFTPDLHDIEGKCYIHFLVWMVIVHSILTFGSLLMSTGPAACDVIMFTINSGALCCYNWLLVISFHVWRITIRPIFRTQMQWFRLYCCYGYGVPLLIIPTAIGHHYLQDINPTTAEVDCLKSGGLAIWIYFFGPIIIMLVVSAGLVIWTSKKLWLDIDRRDQSQSIICLRTKCRICFYLLLITGSVAILDMFKSVLGSQEGVVNYLCDLSECRNLLMGMVVFCILVVLRNKVLKTLAKRGLCCLKFPDNWKKFVDHEREEIENEEATLTHYSSGL